MSELAELITVVEEHTVDDHIGHHGWGVVAKKLLKYLYYYIARCDLWKREAKKQRVIATCRKKLLREGLEATKQADGHWSDRVRWMNWVEKVEKELKDE